MCAIDIMTGQNEQLSHLSGYLLLLNTDQWKIPVLKSVKTILL